MFGIAITLTSAAFLVMAFFAVLPLSSLAADDYKAARTEWGQPDLQGVWNFSSNTPMQRPAIFGEREFLNADEIEEIQRRRAAQDASYDGAGSFRGGVDEAYNDFWVERVERRGFCPSCGARRMVDSAALLVDEVLPRKPIRQWVLTVPFPLRFLFAAYPELMSKVLVIVTRTLSTHLAQQAGFKKKEAHTRAVTLIQRFGSAQNLNIHLHMLFLDGVYACDPSQARRKRIHRRAVGGIVSAGVGQWRSL